MLTRARKGSFLRVNRLRSNGLGRPDKTTVVCTCLPLCEGLLLMLRCDEHLDFFGLDNDRQSPMAPGEHTDMVMFDLLSAGLPKIKRLREPGAVG